MTILGWRLGVPPFKETPISTKQTLVIELWESYWDTLVFQTKLLIASQAFTGGRGNIGNQAKDENTSTTSIIEGGSLIKLPFLLVGNAR